MAFLFACNKAQNKAKEPIVRTILGLEPEVNFEIADYVYPSQQEHFQGSCFPEKSIITIQSSSMSPKVVSSLCEGGQFKMKTPVSFPRSLSSAKLEGSLNSKDKIFYFTKIVLIKIVPIADSEVDLTDLDDLSLNFTHSEDGYGNQVGGSEGFHLIKLCNQETERCVDISGASTEAISQMDFKTLEEIGLMKCKGSYSLLSSCQLSSNTLISYSHHFSLESFESLSFNQSVNDDSGVLY